MYVCIYYTSVVLYLKEGNKCSLSFEYLSNCTWFSTSEQNWKYMKCRI